MTRTVWLATGACLAVIGVLAFVWFAGSGAPQEAPRVAPRAAHQGSGESRSAEDLAEAAAPVAVDEPTRLPSEAERTEVEGAAPGAAGQLELRVVELGTNEPVPGAVVEYVWEREDSEENVPWGYQDMEGFARLARTVRADGQGLARLPRGKGTLYVVAQKGELWGRAELQVDEEGEGDAASEHRVELARDWSLVVQVLDAAGAPAAGVPVSLRRSVGRWRQSAWDEETGGEGFARFPHTGFRLATGGGGDWTVGLKLLLLEPVERARDPEDPPRETIVLRMPPTGAVDVVVHETDGRACPDGTPVLVGIVKEGESRELSPFSPVRRDYRRVVTRDGTAALEHVALGQELEVTVSHEGSRVATKEYGRGPDVPGQRVRIVVLLGADHPVLVFRAVTETGAPFAERELSLRMAMRSEFMSNAWDRSAKTDAEGVFEVDVDNGYQEGELRFLTVRDAEDEGAAVAQVDLCREFPPGPHDMGDLVLGAAPILVAGRVVRTDGSPVSGARVEVQIKLPSSDGQVWWEGLRDDDVLTDQDGAFELRGVASGTELFLEAKRDGLRGEFQLASVGATGLVLVLQATGSLAGSLLVDEGIPTEKLLLKTERSGAPEAPQGMWGFQRDQTRPDAEGRFELEELVPGTYRVQVLVENGRDELATVEPITVAGGEPTLDPRLQPLDLRGRLFVHRLVLVAPQSDGHLAGTLQISEAGAGEGAPREWRWFDESPVEILTSHAAIDVDLGVRGYRGVFLEGLRGEREVRLDAGLPIRLVLRTDGEVPSPPYYVKAVLVPTESGSHANIDWGAPCFDESREIHTRAYGTGRMRVQWVVEKRSAAGGAVATTKEVEPQQFVDVADTTAEQTIEIEISAEQLAALTKDM